MARRYPGRNDPDHTTTGQPATANAWLAAARMLGRHCVPVGALRLACQHAVLPVRPASHASEVLTWLAGFVQSHKSMGQIPRESLTWHFILSP